MGTSKIMFGNAGIDLTQDTVAADKLLKGYTAHNNNGDIITGTYESGPLLGNLYYNNVNNAYGNFLYKNLAAKSRGYNGGSEEKEIKFKINTWSVNNTLSFSFNDLSPLYCEPSAPSIIGKGNDVAGFFKGAFNQNLASNYKNDVNIQIFTDGNGSSGAVYIQTLVINVHNTNNVYQYYMHDLGNLIYTNGRENSIKLTLDGLYINGTLLNDYCNYARADFEMRKHSLNNLDFFMYQTLSDGVIHYFVYPYVDPNTGTVIFYSYEKQLGENTRVQGFWSASTEGWYCGKGTWNSVATLGQYNIINIASFIETNLPSHESVYLQGRPSEFLSQSTLFTSTDKIYPQIGWSTGRQASVDPLTWNIDDVEIIKL